MDGHRENLKRRTRMKYSEPLIGIAAVTALAAGAALPASAAAPAANRN
jgi:hypothetical protein